MMQIGRNLLDAFDGWLLDKTHIIVDRDPLYTKKFRSFLEDEDVEVVRLPASSPNINAYAERFVGSIRRECLNRIVPVSERHLRSIVTQYVEHYNTELNHQGLGNALIAPQDKAESDNDSIRCRERLGGLLNYYYRDAA